MKRLLGTVLSCALGASTLALLPTTSAQAAPVTTAAYSSTASGQAAQVALKVLGASVLNTRVASGTASTDSTKAASSSASTSNLSAALLGAGLTPATSSAQTAPPNLADASTGTLPALDVLGLGVGVLGGSSRAQAPVAGVCPDGGVLARAESTTAGIDLQPAGLVQLLRTSALTTTSTTDLVAGTGALNKQLRSTVTGDAATLGVLGNAVQVGISGSPSLSVTSNGSPVFTPGTVTVNGTQIPLGGSTTVNVALVGSVTVRVNAAPTTTSGTSSISVVSLDISLLSTGILLPPAAQATVDVMPLSVSATAPTSGLDCAPAAPVITTPADGSTTNDSTPTVTGTGVAGSTVTLKEGSTTLSDSIPVGPSGAWTFTPTTALADGPHTLTATQSLAGVASAATTTRFTIDATAPAAPTITSPPTGATIGRTTFPVTGSGEPGASLVVRSGAVASSPVTVGLDGRWATTLGPLTQGAHTLTATQTDAAGNVSQASSSVTVTVNTAALAAPVITAPTNGLVTRTPAQTVRVTARPDASVQLYDGATLLDTATASAAGVVAFSRTLAEGTHTLTAVQTVDGLGRSATSDPVVVRVDTTAPAAPVIRAPQTDTSTADPTPDVSGTGEPGATVTVREGNRTVCTDVVSASGTFACTVDPALTQGTHTFVATQTDAAGNTSPDSNTVTIEVDTAAPAAPVITEPARTSSSTDTTPLVVGTGERGARVSVREDGVELCSDTVGADGTWSCTTTALTPGAHTITAVQTDAAGNSSDAAEPVTYTVTVADTTAPDAPVITAPGATSSGEDPTPQVRGTGEPGARVRVLEGTAELCADTVGTSGTWSCTTTTLAPGAHTITAVQTDPAGNASVASTPVTYTVTVPDTTAPDAPVITTPTAGEQTADTTPTVEGSGEVGAVVTVREGATVLCTDTVGADGRWTCVVDPALAPGSHTVTATQTDAAGNASPASPGRTFTVTAPDTTPPPVPTITSPLPGSSTPDTTPTVSGTAEAGATVTVREGALVLCQDEADAQGDWSCTVSPALSPGAHSITATAADAAGNTSQATPSVGFTVTALDTTAPLAPVIDQPATGTTSPDATPTVSGRGEAGATVTVLAGATPVCTAVVDRLGTWSCTVSPALAVGTYTLTATQADDAGNVSPASEGVTYTVDGTDTEAPTAPVITAPVGGTTTNDQRPTIGGTGETGATVTVREGSTVVCTAVVTAGTWTCTPTTALDGGSHTVTATQTDPAQNLSDPSQPVTFTVEVVDEQAPLAPVIASPTDGDTTTDTTPTVSGTGEPGATVTVKDGTTTVCTVRVGTQGDWTCTPTTPLAGGNHPLTATQTDDADNTSPVSNTVTVTVRVPDTTAPPAPVLTAPTGGSTTADTTPTFEGTGEPGAVVTVTEGGATICTDTVSASGRWSCTPGTELAPGAHVVVATQTDDADNTSVESTPLGFTVSAPDTEVDAPVISAPEDGTSTDDTTPTVSGTGEPGAVVTVREGTRTLCTDTVDTDGRWSCVVAPALDAGAHDLVATQTDRAGNVSDPSTTVTVTVTVADTQAPAAPVIESPENGDRTADTTPTVSGTGEPGAVVTVREGTRTLCTDTVDEDGRWSCTIAPALAAGEHVLVATQSDDAGNTSPDSVAVTVTVTVADTQAPDAPVISTPTGGSRTTDTTPTFTGRGEPGAVVTVREGTATVCTDTVDGNGSWTCTPGQPLAVGDHTFTATQEDEAGNVSSPTAPVVVTIESAPLAPAPPVITSPANGSTTTDTTPTISGTGVASATVTVREGTTLLCTATVGTDGTWRCTLSSPLPVGPHTLVAQQRTATGTSGSSTVERYSITRPVTPPAAPGAPTITDPAQNRYVYTQATSVPVTVAGNGTPGATVTVRDADNRVVGSAKVATNGRWSLRTGKLSSRTYAYRAVQTRSGLTSRSSNTRVFRVVSLRVRIAKGIDPTKAKRPKIRGKGTPGARVTVKTTTGRVLGSAVVDTNGNWSMRSKALKRGTYKVRASQSYRGQKSRSTVVKFRARPRS
ncbi:Ig-like domain-containing protein [Solicola sp. PLA-1-18]|uniref:Ig-like domain-containing protein n=1 Tax=Solicola sp. PLA-1-18 TaxID=3380532 RepID=UPI003B7FF274